MNNIIEKGIGFCQYFYQFFVFNSLFLIINVFFFQILFFIDFKPIFFPLFFLASQTLIPSCVATIRCIKRLRENESLQLFATYIKELLYTCKYEWKIWLSCTLCFYLTMTALYVPLGSTYVTNILMVMNLIIFCLELLLFILIIGNSQKYEGKNLILFSCLRFFKQIPLGILVAVLIAALVIAVQKISFMLILFIFSGALYLSFFIFRSSIKKETL